MNKFILNTIMRRLADMTIKSVGLIVAALAAVIISAGIGQALDPPHWAGNSVQCLSCHQPHKAFGIKLNRAPLNTVVCQGCHNPAGLGKALAMHDSDRAVPGVKGNTHQWLMSVNNPKYGSSMPPDTSAQFSDTDMVARIDSLTDPSKPTVICSTCHHQHDNGEKWGRTHFSKVERVWGSGPTGTVTYALVDHVAKAQGYLIEIVQGGALGTASYIIQDGSLDYNGVQKWFGWDGNQWVEFTGMTSYEQAKLQPRPTGAGQHLRDGPNLTVSFNTSSATFEAGDRFKFYMAYPFLRRPHDSGPNIANFPQNIPTDGSSTYFCRNCHSQRAQSHIDVETWTGTPRSHPVGQGLGSNGKGYDRPRPLDANGDSQSASSVDSPDGNWTNDLLLFVRGTAGTPGSNRVVLPVAATAFGNPESGDLQCMTCHAPHFTDSNSLTVDKR